MWKVLRIPTTSVEGPVIVPGSFETNFLSEVNWSQTSQGLFYSYFGAHEDYASASPKRRILVRYHEINHPETDAVIFESQDHPQYTVFTAIDSEDGSQIVLYRLLGTAEIPQVPLLISREDAFAGHFQNAKNLTPPYKSFGRFLGIRGQSAYLRTSNCSGYGDFYCVVAIDLKTQSQHEVVHARPHAMLIQAQLVGQDIVLQYFNTQKPEQVDIHKLDLFQSWIAVTNLNGKKFWSRGLNEFDVYPVGVVSAFNGDINSRKSEFTFSSALDGVIGFEIDLSSSTLSKLTNSMPTFDKKRVAVSMMEFASGTQKIPLQVFRRTDLVGKSKFVYLFYYGAIGVANFPLWNRKFQMVLDMGATLALVYPRGGAEFGKGWQILGGSDRNKTYDDIVSAARFIRRSPKFNVELDRSGEKRIVAHGRSYGGYFTLALMARNGDDFSAFVPSVPVFDLDYSMRKGTGWWVVDDILAQRDPKTGALVDLDADIQRVAAWNPSSYWRQLKTAKPTLIECGNHDVRVKPTQPYRAAFRLFEKFNDPAEPVFLLDFPNTGHLSRPEPVDEISWLSEVFGIGSWTPLRSAAL